MTDTDDSTSDLGVILGLLRRVRNWLQADVATAAKVPASAVSDYERGKKTPSLRVLRRIVSGMGFRLSAIEETQAFLIGLRRRHGIPSAADRLEAPELWKRLSRYPTTTRRALVCEAVEFQSWALCEFLCFESVRVAAENAEQAVELARLAVELAEHMPGENPWLLRLRGFAWAHLANAWRVAGDHQKAEEAMAKGEKLWLSGRADPSELLSEAWLLGMKASLRMVQRKLPEALALLDRAVELDRDERCRGTLFIARAKALEEFGDFEGSIALLRKAAPFVDPREEPRLYLCLRHNLAEVLATAGRHHEAAAMLPEVAILSRNLGKKLDQLRLRWLEGRIAAGLDEADRAIQILTEVRSQFADRRIFYDCAMVAIELASVYASRGSMQQVKAIARHLVPILASQELHEEALAALAVFRRAAEMEEATVELLGRIWNFLLRARHQAGLRFGEEQSDFRR